MLLIFINLYKSLQIFISLIKNSLMDKKIKENEKYKNKKIMKINKKNRNKKRRKIMFNFS